MTLLLVLLSAYPITLGTAGYIFAGLFVAALAYMAITKQEINLKEADVYEQGFEPKDRTLEIKAERELLGFEYSYKELERKRKEKEKKYYEC